jgi:hydrogenase maturation factor
MSFSSPGQVVSLEPGSIGVVNVSGNPQRVRLGLVTMDGRHIGVGDWILVRHYLAVAVVDPTELPLPTSIRRAQATRRS